MERAKKAGQGRRTDFLACTTNGLIVSVEDDADLVHEADLFFIVAF